jgi:hypothetical protein
MSELKTEPVGSGGTFTTKPLTGSQGAGIGFNAKPVSVSAASVLPTEPHPNPKPPAKQVQEEALANMENEGGHPMVHISREEIAKRAYEIYVESGCVDGRCTENWHQAERELRKLTLAKQDFKNKEE